MRKEFFKIILNAMFFVWKTQCHQESQQTLVRNSCDVLALTSHYLFFFNGKIQPSYFLSYPCDSLLSSLLQSIKKRRQKTASGLAISSTTPTTYFIPIQIRLKNQNLFLSNRLVASLSQYNENTLFLLPLLVRFFKYRLLSL